MRKLARPIPIKCPFCGETAFLLTVALAIGETINPSRHLIHPDGERPKGKEWTNCPGCGVELGMLAMAGVVSAATVAATLAGLGSRRGLPGYGRAAARPRKPLASPLTEDQPNEQPEAGTRVAVMHLTRGAPGFDACGGVACYAHQAIDRRDGFRTDQFAYENGEPVESRRFDVDGVLVYRYVCQSCRGPFGAKDFAQALG